jgi:hypothetical protein
LGLLIFIIIIIFLGRVLGADYVDLLNYFLDDYTEDAFKSCTDLEFVYGNSLEDGFTVRFVRLYKIFIHLCFYFLIVFF